MKNNCKSTVLEYKMQIAHILSPLQMDIFVKNSQRPSAFKALFRLLISIPK